MNVRSVLAQNQTINADPGLIIPPLGNIYNRSLQLTNSPRNFTLTAMLKNRTNFGRRTRFSTTYRRDYDSW